MPVEVDITDETSVRPMVEQTAAVWAAWTFSSTTPR
jgi:hypothetical protein